MVSFLHFKLTSYHLKTPFFHKYTNIQPETPTVFIIKNFSLHMRHPVNTFQTRVQNSVKVNIKINQIFLLKSSV